jgi:CRP-like cAMP-binding protein
MQSILPKPSKSAVIQSCTLLNGLGEGHVSLLMDKSNMAYASRGEPIWHAGMKPEFCAVIGAGFVKMTKSTPHGTDMVMELFGPGQCFGLVAVAERRDYPLSATAVTNCWYLKLPARDMQDIYDTDSILKDRIVKAFGSRLRKAHDMMSRLSSGKVEERIAAVLFSLADSYGRRTAAGVELEVPLTRSDISEMAGTTTETTIRVLSRWQKEGIVSTDRHVITILNQDALSFVLQG